MKKIIFLSLLSALCYSLSFGQIENRFSIGPRLGANFSNTNAEGTKNLTGLAAGITSTYSINERSGITVDLLYSGEGHKTGNLEVHRNYLKIPVLYNSFLGRLGESFRPKLYLGFAPGFLLNAEANNTDIKNQNNSTTLDLVGGLGFNQRLANRIWLNADLRAFWGLNAIGKTGDTKNRTIQASMGVAYGI
ncbi:MAG: porin family protein [Saprospiraceae bacterium]|nr:porin family protein [Saprospiraceae bacterium]